MNAIVVHGGCHEHPVEDARVGRLRAGVAHACAVGYEVLRETGSAIDAVERAVWVLEDDPLFDAGTGSYPNLLGEVEMDAMLATSDSRVGGVAAIGGVRHPIAIARMVMERTPHVLLVGRGAELFARAMGVPPYDPTTDGAQRGHAEQVANLDAGLADILPKYAELRTRLKNTSTVGAVAIDHGGRIAAATSTGGIPQKLPGRIGDSALLGAGTYASPAGGASASGVGEMIIRLHGTRTAVESMSRGIPVLRALESTVEPFTRAGSPCGLVALDARGEAATFHNGYLMPVFHASDERPDTHSIELLAEGAAYLDQPFT